MFPAPEIITPPPPKEAPFGLQFTPPPMKVPVADPVITMEASVPPAFKFWNTLTFLIKKLQAPLMDIADAPLETPLLYLVTPIASIVTFCEVMVINKLVLALAPLLLKMALSFPAPLIVKEGMLMVRFLSVYVPESINIVSPGPAKAKAAVKVNFGKAAVKPLLVLLPTADVKVSPVVEASFT